MQIMPNHGLAMQIPTLKGSSALAAISLIVAAKRALEQIISLPLVCLDSGHRSWNYVKPTQEVPSWPLMLVVN